MPSRALVFDMDGVLVDVSASYRETIIRTVEHFTGARITPELIQDYKNRGGWNNDWALSREIASSLGVEVAYDTVVEYFNSIFLGNGGDGLITRERWLAQPGLLERLGENQALAVFTGRNRLEASITLGRFARGLRFDPVVTTDDVIEGKPAPDGLLKIAAALPGAELWYVGDTVDDARSAQAAGVPFVGIAAAASPRRRELAAALAASGAAAVLESINELEGVLANR